MSDNRTNEKRDKKLKDRERELKNAERKSPPSDRPPKRRPSQEDRPRRNSEPERDDFEGSPDGKPPKRTPRKKSQGDNKTSKGRDSARKRSAKGKRPQEEKDRDYGDEFYADEAEFRRRKAKQRMLEKEALEKFDIDKQPMSHRRRKLKNIGIAAAIISIILAVGIALSLTVFFRSEQFQVEGAEHYSAQDVIDASGLVLGENLFLSDKSAGEENIESKLPYIEEAKISIKIPSTMVITVTESKPAFIIENNGEYIIVSASGKIMEKVKGSTDNYDAPTVVGATVKKATVGQGIEFKESGILKILTSISTALTENEFSGIKEIDVSNTASISLNYSNRIKIIIGLPEDVSYKLKTAKIIISDKLSETDRGELDVSGCKEGNKASYFKPDPSIYLDRIEKNQPSTTATEPTESTEATQPSDDITAETDAYSEEITDETYYESTDDDYSNGVPQYTYPTDAYGNIIYSDDSDQSYETGDDYYNDDDNGYMSEDNAY